MRASDLPTSLAARIRHPGRGFFLLLLGVGWAVVRLNLNTPYGRFGPGEAFLPLALLAGSFVLAPLAWQWTGDARPLAPPTRGLLQSLAFNSGWLLALTFAFSHFGGPPQPKPQPFDAGQPRPPGPLEPGRRPPPPRDGEGGRPPVPWEPAPPPRVPPASPELFLFSLGLVLATVLGRSLAEGDASREREVHLRDQAEQARALALQAQMQPHALFNALSGLVELAREDPQATEDALVALCDYLRRLMAHAHRTVAPLQAERQLLEDYLRIEQIRLGERLRVQWAWPAWADTLQLPPLLLQPLVENAVLHGIAKATEGGDLRIALTRRDQLLILEVANTGHPPAGSREGMGLGHLRERLALWRPEAVLDLRHEAGWTRARIRIPEAAPSP